MRQIFCFDLWGTLIHSTESDGASYQQVLTDHGVRFEDIYPFVCERLMTRRLSYEQMAEELMCHFQLAGRPDAKEVARAIVDSWERDNEYCAWFPDALPTLQWLRKRGDTLTLITNITLPGWEAVQRVLGVAEWFDTCIVSCDVGYTKPNELIFGQYQQRVDDRLDTSCYHWMIGDREEDDLAVPRKLGWNTLLVSPDDRNIIERIQLLESAEWRKP